MSFLRFAGIVLLVVIGFGTGICGLFGMAMTIAGGADDFTVPAFILSTIAILVSVGCFFGIRALTRRWREAQAKVQPTEQPKDPQ
jgi:hypothetical protein